MKSPAAFAYFHSGSFSEPSILMEASVRMAEVSFFIGWADDRRGILNVRSSRKKRAVFG
jgi:hypothetical protein